MVKVLVTGATGQVGSELLKLAPAGFKVLGYRSDELDITNNKQVLRILKEQSPDIIINAAAYTAVDKAESDVDLAYAVNELGVKNLAQAALILNIPVFHVSTDYVFDGSSDVPYKETDLVNPGSVYGSSKLAGEKALADIGVKHIILRTSWVFGTEGKNFVKTMIRLGAERDVLGVVADQFGCPTSAVSIADTLWQLVDMHFSRQACPWGIYHFSNQPATSWHDFAEEIFRQAVHHKILNHSPKLNPIATDAYPTPARRPPNAVLECEKIKSLVKNALPQWKYELNNMIKELHRTENSCQ